MLRHMTFLPALIDLRGQPAVVVGGGPVALRRTRTLLGAGVQVQVIAPHLHPEFRALPVQLHERPYRQGDLRGARLVVAATDDAQVNADVTAEAHQERALLNHAADASQGDLRFPAVTERAGVQVAVSTGRELPMLAQALTNRIAALLPDDAQLGRWATVREQALALTGAAREQALGDLRHDIDRALGGQP